MKACYTLGNSEKTLKYNIINGVIDIDNISDIALGASAVQKQDEWVGVVQHGKDVSIQIRCVEEKTLGCDDPVRHVWIVRTALLLCAALLARRVESVPAIAFIHSKQRVWPVLHPDYIWTNTGHLCPLARSRCGNLQRNSWHYLDIGFSTYLKKTVQG